MSVADPSSTNTGKLVNGVVLPADDAAGDGDRRRVRRRRRQRHPDVAEDLHRADQQRPLTLTFKQRVNANDALRTGTYSKTLTFTLSTTSP